MLARLYAFILLMCVVPLAASAAPAPACGEGNVSVTGVLSDRIVEQIPGAAPRITFVLSRPSCGSSAIVVSMEGALQCPAGMWATVNGIYSAPFPPAFKPSIRGAKVNCGPLPF